MDSVTLNEILSFFEVDFEVNEKLPATGQREVFRAIQTSTTTECVLKICTVIPVNVARIQREIRILEGLDSEYFPKFLYQSFITDSILDNFYDNFDTRLDEQKLRLDELRGMRIKPFLLTVEEFIDHISWEDCFPLFRHEKSLVDLLFHLFNALSLLWQAKIVHRDLKPENILIRENLRPVIIDLGIAKSFRDGTLDFTLPLLQTPCTPRFAALEQLINNKTDITYKTDQFSIGVIAFLVLTEHFPYGDEQAAGIEQVVDNMMNGRVEALQTYNNSVSEGLTQFIKKLLQPHPYKRFRNIETILQRLNDIRESLA